MGKGKNAKKRPVTHVQLAKGWGKKGHQKLIAGYHAKKKRLEMLRANPPAILSEDEIANEITQLEEELEKGGGLNVYQAASKRGEKMHAGFNAAKWVVAMVTEQQLRPASPGDAPLRLLDVGALGENYAKYRTWMHVTAIDINSQHPFVKEIDFFDLPMAEDHYDIIVLSLVVNFVPDIARRGEMLRLSRRHLRNDGHMFLVLPLPCVDNSRYMDETRLLAILKAVGYELVLKQHTPKLAMYMVRAVSADSAEPKTFGKELIRGGKERNNFAIVLK